MTGAAKESMPAGTTAHARPPSTLTICARLMPKYFSAAGLNSVRRQSRSTA